MNSEKHSSSDIINHHDSPDQDLPEVGQAQTGRWYQQYQLTVPLLACHHLATGTWRLDLLAIPSSRLQQQCSTSALQLDTALRKHLRVIDRETAHSDLCTRSSAISCRCPVSHDD